MKRVTRNIDLGRGQELLARAPRACISFADEHGPLALPIVLMWHDDRYLAGVTEDADRLSISGREVVLLVDEGVHFFDLRAIYIRGLAKPTDAPEEAPAGRTWFEVVPLKTVAWDYGQLREVTDES